MRSDGRECNGGMTIAKCTKTAASSNDSNHLSRTPAAWFASGTARVPVLESNVMSGPEKIRSRGQWSHIVS